MQLLRLGSENLKSLTRGGEKREGERERWKEREETDNIHRSCIRARRIFLGYKSFRNSRAIKIPAQLLCVCVMIISILTASRDRCDACVIFKQKRRQEEKKKIDASRTIAYQDILSLSITFSHNICQWMHFDHAHIYCNFFVTQSTKRTICAL